MKTEGTKSKKITKEKFEAYEEVRKSGRTNMFALQNVMDLAEGLCNIELTADDCIYIMKNYNLLKELEEVTEKAGYGVYTKPV